MWGGGETIKGGEGGSVGGLLPYTRLSEAGTLFLDIKWKSCASLLCHVRAVLYEE